MKSKFLYLFRLPETVVAFLSGALISASINIFTSPDLNIKWYYLTSAGLLVIASLMLVIWSIVIKPVETEFQEERNENKDRLITFWSEKLLAHKRVLPVLIVCFIVFVLTFFASILFIVIPSFLPIN